MLCCDPAMLAGSFACVLVAVLAVLSIASIQGQYAVSVVVVVGKVVSC